MPMDFRKSNYALNAAAIESALARIPPRAPVAQPLKMNKSAQKRPAKKRADKHPFLVPVAISAAHVHLTPAVIEALFCDSYRLHEHSGHVQPTYSARELVTLIGPHGRLSNVRVIGPPRSVDQVEISQTDARTLGIDAPVRESGSLEGTPGILIEGPRTRVRLERGVIRALRHVHMSPSDADCLGFKDQDRIAVANAKHTGQILFHDVLVRVSPGYRLELHLDADEAAAAGLSSGDFVVLSKGASAQVQSAADVVAQSHEHQLRILK
ncbi:MAG: PduL/EutD family phosphate acyltransferase [Steroidobacteraceae bacterium]